MLAHITSSLAPMAVVEGRPSLEATLPSAMVEWRPSGSGCFFWSNGGHSISSRPMCRKGGSGSSSQHPWSSMEASASQVTLFPIAFSISVPGSFLQKSLRNFPFPLDLIISTTHVHQLNLLAELVGAHYCTHVELKSHDQPNTMFFLLLIQVCLFTNSKIVGFLQHTRV